jgi:hypothetical protein
VDPVGAGPVRARIRGLEPVMNSRLLHPLPCLVLLLGPGPAGARPPLPAEAEAHARILAALGAALPDLPGDWEALHAPEPPPLGTVSAGQERFPMRFDLARSWRNPQVQERMVRARDEELARLQPRLQEDAARAGTFQEERMAILRPQMAARDRGDAATAGRLGRELERLEAAQAPRIRESEELMKAALRRTSVHDGTFELRIAVNEAGTLLAGARPEPPPVPGALAFRAPGGEDAQGAWTEGTTTVLLGPWRAARRKDMDGVEVRVPVTARAGCLQPQSVLLSCQGDEARVRRFLEGVDWARLRGLLPQPSGRQ